MSGGWTKGEWTVREGQRSISVTAPLGRIASLTIRSDSDRATVLANARLKAAAPELFDALEALFLTFQARRDMLALCGFAEHAQLASAADALNKAIGEDRP